MLRPEDVRISGQKPPTLSWQYCNITLDKRRKTMSQIPFIDLFAGAGGLSLGLIWAGAAPVYAVEQDKWAAETYVRNHPGVPMDQRDIREISDSEIAGLKKLGARMIVGGPPCQGFSHSNVNRDPKDPRNSLFQDFVRFARILQPEVCIIENVAGLLKTRVHTGELVISLIDASLNEIGYRSEHRVLEASEYGVPQKRERLFIVAVRKDIKTCASIWPKASHSCEKEQLQIPMFDDKQLENNAIVTLWDAISDLPMLDRADPNFNPHQSYNFGPQNEFQRLMRESTGNLIANHEPMKHTARILERFQSISFGQSETDVPMNLRPRKRGSPLEMSGRTYDQNSRRQKPDAPCNTVVASSHTNFIHPTLHRNFTVREMMRVQSFPDSFIVCGKRAVLSKKLSEKKGLVDDLFLDQRAQIGNAVPPLLAKKLGISIITALSRSIGRVDEAA